MDGQDGDNLRGEANAEPEPSGAGRDSGDGGAGRAGAGRQGDAPPTPPDDEPAPADDEAMEAEAGNDRTMGSAARDGEAALEHPWLAHRKRIVAREVRLAARCDLDPAQIPPPVLDAVLEAPAPPKPPRLGELMLDPTTLGSRRRKRAHAARYAAAWLAIVLTWAGVLACTALMLRDHVHRARVGSVVTLILALASIRWARGTKLSRRLLGYAIAGAVMACLSLAFCLAGPSWAPTHQSPAPPPDAPPPRVRTP